MTKNRELGLLIQGANSDDGVHKQILANHDPEERKWLVELLKQRDASRIQGAIFSMALDTHLNDNNTYRVFISPRGVDIVCFGIESIDSQCEGHYDKVDDLPCWVKQRLAVLMVLSFTPPTQELEGVGRRISEKVFWVFAPKAFPEASVSA